MNERLNMKEKKVKTCTCTFCKKMYPAMERAEKYLNPDDYLALDEFVQWLFACDTDVAMSEIKLTERIEEAEEKLNKISNWVHAYPISVFPEPDLEKAAKILKENGMTLAAISASNMRHVLNGIAVIIGNK